jgi:hypothetical protein
MLGAHPGVIAADASFSNHCLRIELGSMLIDELVELLHRNLHGVAVAGNGDRVMVDIEPAIEWHCHGGHDGEEETTR